MTREQRTAMARIISDMIKADNIIEESGIKNIKKFMSDYGITHLEINGLKPMEMTQMYFSHANEDKNLLYLSATPVKPIVSKQEIEIKDSVIPMGSVVEGSVVHIDKNSFIIKSEDGQTAYLHRSTWGEYSMKQFNKGQMVRVEKAGFDNEHKKHVWKTLSVYWPMASGIGN